MSRAAEESWGQRVNGSKGLRVNKSTSQKVEESNGIEQSADKLLVIGYLEQVPGKR